jgi:hypothetical protein
MALQESTCLSNSSKHLGASRFLIVVVNEATTPKEKIDRHYLHNCHVSFVEIVSASFNLPHISLNIPESLHSK